MWGSPRVTNQLYNTVAVQSLVPILHSTVHHPGDGNLSCNLMRIVHINNAMYEYHCMTEHRISKAHSLLNNHKICL